MEQTLGPDRTQKELSEWTRIFDRLFPDDHLAPDVLQIYEEERVKYFVSTFYKKSLLHTMIQPHQG